MITSWDMAKFEVCCHKWADLSENGYGVSILNDSKYGFATWGNLMRLSLLRAPKAPDAHADMGRHHIRYGILPHIGPLDARIVRAGYNFNSPLVLKSGSGRSEGSRSITGRNNPFQAFSVTSSATISGGSSLILDTVKRGEDDEDVSRDTNLVSRRGQSIILRIYESLGGKARGVIRSKLPVKAVWKCNVLEDDEIAMKVKRGEGGDEGDEEVQVEIELRAFEVATYRLQL